MSFTILKEYFQDKLQLIPRDLDEEENVDGKIAIVTGANSGLGKATSLELVKKGAIVIMACRDMEKAAQAVQEISSKTSKGKLIPMRLDLANIASIETFVASFKEEFQMLHILINNAGIVDHTGIPKKTSDGFELYIGVNHLGHFLLTSLLQSHLRRGRPSRVVCVSSSLHLTADYLDVDNLMMEKPNQGKTQQNRAYGNSKLANALFALELSKRLGRSGVTSYSLCPGIVNTEINRNGPPIPNAILQKCLKNFAQTPEKGCETILYCALSKKCKNQSGKMYRFGKLWEKGTIGLDAGKAKILWEKSEELVNYRSRGVHII